MIKVATCLPLTEAQLARLAAAGCAVRRIAEDEVSDCPIVFGNPSPAALAANAALCWLQLESAGFGEYVGQDWSRPAGPVQVTNLAGFFAEPVAESALAGILALCRGIDRLVRLQDRGIWEGDPIRTRLRRLQGARVVLFGHGAINRRLGALLAPFGCAITPFGRYWTDAELNSALSSADVVACCVPATPQTCGLFNAARIALLRPGAIFCNFGRGSLLDEEALDAALRADRLGGAVIDVTRDEPLPSGHPFWTSPNLILTQHSGGGSADEMDRKITVFLDNLSRFRAGQPLVGLVDFSRGY